MIILKNELLDFNRNKYECLTEIKLKLIIIKPKLFYYKIKKEEMKEDVLHQINHKNLGPKV